MFRRALIPILAVAVLTVAILPLLWLILLTLPLALLAFCVACYQYFGWQLGVPIAAVVFYVAVAGIHIMIQRKMHTRALELVNRLLGSEVLPEPNMFVIGIIIAISLAVFGFLFGTILSYEG